MNMAVAREILQSLCRVGVEDFVCCAGARNAPFISTIANAMGIQSYSLFEERSAGFFALGLSQKKGRPVALFTTSGTATAELLPAIIEGHYSQTPLIVVSSDRPKQYRGSGAPQAIEQVGLFSHYVSRTWDIHSNLSELDLEYAPMNGPLHINVCFDEPLLDEEQKPLQLNPASMKRRVYETTNEEHQYLHEFFKNVRSPLVIVSQLRESVEFLVDELVRINAPLYLEAGSGLIGDSRLSDLIVRGGERHLVKYIDQGLFDGVLRIGGTPTARVWRDLEDRWRQLPVLSVSSLPFSGLSREKRPPLSISSFERLIKAKQTINFSPKWQEQFLPTNRMLTEKVKELLLGYPKSELSWMSRVQSWISPEDSVFVGNSLPIREWDLVGSLSETPLPYASANRGANGIDGLISTMLGGSSADQRCWCILGDLSALYDLNALWIEKILSERELKIVVINNGGGQIFRQLFNSPDFENRHVTHFQGWADMFNWRYQALDAIEDVLLAEGSEIIEVLPSEEQSDKIWHDYKRLL